jgi:hypothetical protein
VIAVTAAIVLTTRHVAGRLFETTRPPVAAVDIRAVYFDETPVHLTTTVAWQTVPAVATRDAVRADATLWRRMHVADWDTVPAPLRYEALEAMLDRYAGVLAAPAVWDRMDAFAWDAVPQPIRALAFRHMTQFWSGYDDVGVKHGLPANLVADTLTAIVMAESWFEHRAMNTTPWGNRDLGVAQASTAARARMVEWFHVCLVEVMFVV